MIEGIRHTGIVVQNLEKVKNFWIKLMGFSVFSEALEEGPHLDLMMGLNGVKVTTCKLKARDGKMIELLKFHSNEHLVSSEWKGTAFSRGLTHIAFDVKDLDMLYAERHFYGLIFGAKPQLSPNGKVKVSYCRGPENLLLELVETL